jgi:hypothetical protein
MALEFTTGRWPTMAPNESVMEVNRLDRESDLSFPYVIV